MITRSRDANILPLALGRPYHTNTISISSLSLSRACHVMSGQESEPESQPESDGDPSGGSGDEEADACDQVSAVIQMPNALPLNRNNPADHDRNHPLNQTKFCHLIVPSVTRRRPSLNMIVGSRFLSPA